MHEEAHWMAAEIRQSLEEIGIDDGEAHGGWPVYIWPCCRAESGWFQETWLDAISRLFYPHNLNLQTAKLRA